jgi:hypothetical protein
MYRRTLLLGSPMLGLAACAPPVSTGVSNKSDAYQHKISRVLVAKAFNTPLLTEKQANVFISAEELQQSLAAKWLPLGVTWQVVDIDATTEKKKALDDATTSFAPTEILTLVTKSVRIIGSFIRVVDGYGVDASLSDVSEKKRVWRTEVEFKPFASGGRMRHGFAGSAIPHQDDANDLIDALTAKLKSDGML